MIVTTKFWSPQNDKDPKKNHNHRPNEILHVFSPFLSDLSLARCSLEGVSKRDPDAWWEIQMHYGYQTSWFMSGTGATKRFEFTDGTTNGNKNDNRGYQNAINGCCVEQIKKRNNNVKKKEEETQRRYWNSNPIVRCVTKQWRTIDGLYLYGGTCKSIVELNSRGR